MSTPTSFPDPMRQTQPLVVDKRIKRMIAGAVAEIDPAQIAILRTLTAAKRVWQAFAMIEDAERAGVYRLRQRQPELSEEDAVRMVRQRGLKLRAQMEERWRKNRIGCAVTY